MLDLVHLAHAANADPPNDAVVTDFFALLHRHLTTLFIAGKNTLLPNRFDFTEALLAFW
jgi:hypothetical protein